jgi:hypothetical protein
MRVYTLLLDLAVGARLGVVDWVNWAFGCSHRKTSFPLSVRTGGRLGGPSERSAQVYVVCLSCGQRLAHAGPRLGASGWWWRGGLQQSSPWTWKSLAGQRHRGVK